MLRCISEEFVELVILGSEVLEHHHHHVLACPWTRPCNAQDYRSGEELLYERNDVRLVHIRASGRQCYLLTFPRSSIIVVILRCVDFDLAVQPLSYPTLWPQDRPPYCMPLKRNKGKSYILNMQALSKYSTRAGTSIPSQLWTQWNRLLPRATPCRPPPTSLTGQTAPHLDIVVGTTETEMKTSIPRPPGSSPAWLLGTIETSSTFGRCLY